MLKSTHLLKSVDKFLPYWIFPLVKMLSVIVPRRSSLPQPRTLIIRPGGLGDLVCCHIAMETLGINPLDVDWVIERRSAAWAELHNFKYICFDNLSIKNVISLLGKYKIIINTEQYYGLSQVFAQLLLYSEGKIFSFDSNKGASISYKTVSYTQNNEHESFLFAKLFAQALDIEQRYAPLRKRAFPSQGYTLLALGGSQMESRHLPAETWERFTKFFLQNSLKISAGPGDFDLLQQIKTKFPHAQVIDGDFSHFISAAASAEKILTIDSGAVHVASYYGVPVFALYTSGQENKWSPLSLHSKILKNNYICCRPCVLWGSEQHCRNNFICKNIHF